MSLDRSLKVGGGLTRHRNVLTRAERLDKLAEEERWDEEKSVFGLPKVANRNVAVGKKVKKKEEGAGEGEKAVEEGKEPAKEGDS